MTKLRGRRAVLRLEFVCHNDSIGFLVLDLRSASISAKLKVSELIGHIEFSVLYQYQNMSR